MSKESGCWPLTVHSCASSHWTILEFLGSSKQCSTAELPALPADLRVGTLQTALCRCCKLYACAHPPCEWHVSICAVPRRIALLKICEEAAQLCGFPLLVPTLAGPVQGTWWVWCLTTCWWWPGVPPTARSRLGVDRWRSLAEDGNRGCTAPLV